jgi:hypothetical protein
MSILSSEARVPVPIECEAEWTAELVFLREAINLVFLPGFNPRIIKPAT